MGQEVDLRYDVTDEELGLTKQQRAKIEKLETPGSSPVFTFLFFPSIVPSFSPLPPPQSPLSTPIYLIPCYFQSMQHLSPSPSPLQNYPQHFIACLSLLLYMR
jgi:hypothetical protein